MKITGYILLGLFLSGCVHYVPAAISSTAIGQNEKVIGIASGKGESLEEAVENAIGTSGANTMINVFADTEWSCFWGCAPTGITRVYGTLIKYVDNDGTDLIPTEINVNINELKSGDSIVIMTKDGKIIDGIFQMASQNYFYYQPTKSSSSNVMVRIDNLKSISRK